LKVSLIIIQVILDHLVASGVSEREGVKPTLPEARIDLLRAHGVNNGGV
jgi:hypothetical protein